MVKTVSFLGLLLIASPCLADGHPDAGVTPSMRSPRLPAISELDIEKNGATSPAATTSPKECKDFVLSEAEVKAFLRRSGEVSEHDFHHMLEWSPCYASGKVTFAGGLSGSWGIHRFKAGSVHLSDGRVVYLYCPRCRARAF